MQGRAQLIRCLEGLLALLESRVVSLDGTFYVSAQQPFADVAPMLWHLRRGETFSLRYLALQFAEKGPLWQLAAGNGWTDDYALLRSDFEKAFAILNRIRYHGSEQAVEVGDHVGLRVLFRNRTGRVVYLPGHSAPRPDIDFGGIFRVGIQTLGGPFVMVHVDGDLLEVKKGVTFLRRDTTGIPKLPTPEELEE